MTPIIKSLIKSQCNLAILPSDILPAEETETEEKLETLKDMAAKYAIPEDSVYY